MRQVCPTNLDGTVRVDDCINHLTQWVDGGLVIFIGGVVGFLVGLWLRHQAHPEEKLDA